MHFPRTMLPLSTLLLTHASSRAHDAIYTAAWRMRRKGTEVERQKALPTDPDVGVGEGPGGVADLVQDLAGVGAPEHGQLVHGPVPASI